MKPIVVMLKHVSKLIQPMRFLEFWPKSVEFVSNHKQWQLISHFELIQLRRIKNNKKLMNLIFNLIHKSCETMQFRHISFFLCHPILKNNILEARLQEPNKSIKFWNYIK